MQRKSKWNWEGLYELLPIQSKTCCEHNSTTESTSTKNQSKLSSMDISAIKKTFSTLKEEDMWKLSTKTLVEKKMQEHAFECIVEQ